MRFTHISPFSAAAGIAAAATLLTLAAPRSAHAQVVWTDWVAGVEGPNGSATGTLLVNGTTVGVSYVGEIAFIQTDANATNYWQPDEPYKSATVPNAPPPGDIIALSLATSKTITFSQAITNPLFAVVSLNGNGYRFDRDFQILSFGEGFWGNGTLTKADAGAGFFQLNGSGEPHGVIEFQGTFSSITWTSLTDEYWNGFTIGVRGLAPTAVDAPEPSALALLLPALPIVGMVARKRRSKA
jgi:hypothetical protein